MFVAVFVLYEVLKDNTFDVRTEITSAMRLVSYSGQ